MTLHVSLPEELEKPVHQEVKTGMYDSASESVREALQDEMQERRQHVLSGEADLEDGEAFFENIKIKYDLDD